MKKIAKLKTKFILSKIQKNNFASYIKNNKFIAFD